MVGFFAHPLTCIIYEKQKILLSLDKKPKGEFTLKGDGSDSELNAGGGPNVSKSDFDS